MNYSVSDDIAQSATAHFSHRGILDGKAQWLSATTISTMGKLRRQVAAWKVDGTGEIARMSSRCLPVSQVRDRRISGSGRRSFAPSLLLRRRLWKCVVELFGGLQNVSKIAFALVALVEAEFS